MDRVEIVEGKGITFQALVKVGLYFLMSNRINEAEFKICICEAWQSLKL